MELDSFATNKNLPKVIMTKISDWKNELKKLKILSSEINNFKSDQEMQLFIDKNLTQIEQNNPSILFEDKAITALYYSGILSKYLERKLDAKLESKIFYWLAIYDKRLNSQLFYSLGDTYLKFCIKKSPHSKIASECYQIMEDDTYFHYSGSMGTNLPVEVKQDLLKWKKLSEIVKSKKK
jgi:hypothetical protein